MMRTVYTAIFGNYDQLHEPKIISPGVRHICYTDQNLKSNVWEIIHSVLPHDNVRNARYVKVINPWSFYGDQFMWIDANQQINCDLNKLFDMAREPFTLLKHPDRNCIYAEAAECIRLKKDREPFIKAQVDGYRQEGYPANNGMVATGLIIRTNTKDVDHFCKKWFTEIMQGSYRDQLSFNYTLWKNPMPIHLLPFETLKQNFIRCPHKEK